MAILLGLVWVTGSDVDLTDIAVGAAQILYGVLAFVTLKINMNGTEFHRPRVQV
jgi:hypothetical protein